MLAARLMLAGGGVKNPPVNNGNEVSDLTLAASSAMFRVPNAP